MPGRQPDVRVRHRREEGAVRRVVEGRVRRVRPRRAAHAYDPPARHMDMPSMLSRLIFDTNETEETKTKQTRKIPISSKLRIELDTWKAYVEPESESEYIFKGRFGSHLTRQSMDKKLKQYSPYKGVSTHSFRRSCLTALNRAKVPLNVIASLSGHSSMNSLRLYLGIDEKVDNLAPPICLFVALQGLPNFVTALEALLPPLLFLP